MIGLLAPLVGVGGLLLALGAGAYSARDRRVGNAYLVAMAVVEALTVVQLVVALVLTAGGSGADDTATATAFGYLLLAVLLLPGALLWSLEEPTRWGTAVLSVGGLVLAGVEVRLLAVWTGG